MFVFSSIQFTYGLGRVGEKMGGGLSSMARSPFYCSSSSTVKSMAHGCGAREQTSPWVQLVADGLGWWCRPAQSHLHVTLLFPLHGSFEANINVTTLLFDIGDPFGDVWGFVTDMGVIPLPTIPIHGCMFCPERGHC